ncbi:g9557 [Coccomyxa viridis]|uniref:G9557 protein n=1 Tax=Coccomyxa viridis TaxID=1274662 RepID=A0ABP1G7G8_9CHLO
MQLDIAWATSKRRDFREEVPLQCSAHAPKECALQSLISAACSGWKDVEHLASAQCCTAAILVVGGEGSNGPLSSAELYDPTSNTWRSTGSLSNARSCLRAVVQQQHHRVLAIGGRDDAGALSTTSRMFFQAEALLSGQILAAGGVDNTGIVLASADLYSPF